MKFLLKNKYIESVIISIVIYALFHSFTMILHVFVSGEYETINGFRILGINLFFPDVDKGIGSFLLSWIILGIVPVVVYYFRNIRIK